MKNFTDWLESTARRSYGFQIAHRLILADGTSLSIQASSGHYSEPRETIPYKCYESFEIGFPSAEIPEIMQFAGQEENPTDTVYPYVPVGIINKLIEDRGGVVGQYVDGKQVMGDGNE